MGWTYVIIACQKKPSLVPDDLDLNSFYPISNLTFLSKFVERVVATQFMDHADQNDLSLAKQSASVAGSQPSWLLVTWATTCTTGSTAQMNS